MKKSTEISVVIVIISFFVLIIAGEGAVKWFLKAWGEWFEAFAWLGTTMTSVLAWWNSSQARKEASAREKIGSQLISIVLTSGDEEVQLPCSPRRKDVSRGELMGLVGTFYGAGRFNFPNMATLLSSGKLQEVQNGSSSELRIEIPGEDLQKFKAFIG